MGRVTILLFVISCFIAATLSHRRWGHGNGERKGGLLKKIFKKRHEKWTPHPMHVQTGEQTPNDQVKDLVQHHAEAIKARANLNVTGEDKKDFEEAPVDPLSFIMFITGRDKIFLIKVIIGNQFIVHVKIGVKMGQENDPESSTLMVVLTDKGELDKLDKEEFEEV